MLKYMCVEIGSRYKAVNVYMVYFTKFLVLIHLWVHNFTRSWNADYTVCVF